jgi:hypothetical protein
LSIRAGAVRHPVARSTQSEEHAMKYMLLIYGPDPTGSATEEAIQESIDAYWAYEKAVADAGVRIASDALQGTATATTIEVRTDGERVVTDGPFAETREILGGYYLLDVPDLDAALDWAARCPGAQGGSRIEVRPVHEFAMPDRP